MKRFQSLFLVLLLSIISISVFSQSFNQPILISSAGQSADVKLVKLLADRQKLDSKTLPMATPEDLVGIKSLVIVPGFSSKGLGAAGISMEDELKRVNELVDAANAKNIPIILIHIGGNARRLGQSDNFNSLVGKNSKHMIVVAQGNEDNFFSEIASENSIPLDLVNSMVEVSAPLKKLFK